MPVDLRNHVVTLTGASVQVGPSALTTTRQYTVSGGIFDSQTGASVAAYNFTFPNVLSTLTQAQSDPLMQYIYRYLITVKTGF